MSAVVFVSHPEIRRASFSLNSDEPSFHGPASALALTGQYSDRPGTPPSAFRPPGLILPLAGLYYLTRPSPLVGVAYVMLCGLAIVVMAHRLALATCRDQRVALLAALLAACMPTLVFTSSGIWSEPQAILLTLLLLWLLVRRQPDGVPSTGGWAVIGLCGSLACLTRPSAGFLFPFLAIGAFLSARGSRRLLKTAVLAVSLLLLVSLWGFRNYVTFGHLLIGGAVSGEVLWGSNNPVTAGVSLPAQRFRGKFNLYEEARQGRYLGSWVRGEYIPGWSEAVPADASDIAVYRHQMQSTLKFITQEPGNYLWLLGHKMWRLVTVEPYAPSITLEREERRRIHRPVTLAEYWFIVGWGVIGMVQLTRLRRPVAYWYASFVLAGIVSVLVAYPNPRFLLPVTTVLLTPAALSLTRAYDRVIARHRSDPVHGW